VVGSGELVRACAGGSTSLGALEMVHFGREGLPAACAVLSCLPGLTMQNLRVQNWCSWDHDIPPFDEHDQPLTSALSQQPHLRHLEVQAAERGFMPCQGMKPAAGHPDRPQLPQAAVPELRAAQGRPGGGRRPRQPQEPCARPLRGG
jgi:hypothetical protein